MDAYQIIIHQTQADNYAIVYFCSPADNTVTKHSQNTSFIKYNTCGRATWAAELSDRMSLAPSITAM